MSEGGWRRRRVGESADGGGEGLGGEWGSVGEALTVGGWRGGGEGGGGVGGGGGGSLLPLKHLQGGPGWWGRWR